MCSCATRSTSAPPSSPSDSGVPCATVLCIASASFVPAELVSAPLNELRAAHGLPPDPGLAMLAGDLVLSPFPSSLREPGSTPALHAFRASARPRNRTATTLEALLVLLSDGPVVYLTLGTIFNQESGDLFERAIAGLRELPGHLVVTVGRELDPASLGPVPPHVHLRPYIPQSLLLPRVDLVVAHGGSGSLLGALSHGLPLVFCRWVPISRSTPAGPNSSAWHWRSTRLRRRPMRSALRLRAVLDDPAYRRCAERIRDEIAALPGPEHAVALLESLLPRTLPSR